MDTGSGIAIPIIIIIIIITRLTSFAWTFTVACYEEIHRRSSGPFLYCCWKLTWSFPSSPAHRCVRTPTRDARVGDGLFYSGIGVLLLQLTILVVAACVDAASTPSSKRSQTTGEPLV